MLELYNTFKYFEMESAFIFFVILIGILLIKWAYQFYVWRRRENIETELLILLRHINSKHKY